MFDLENNRSLTALFILFPNIHTYTWLKSPSNLPEVFPSEHFDFDQIYNLDTGTIYNIQLCSISL